MTGWLLGVMPAWAWIAASVGVWTAAGAWSVVVGPELRLRHRLTCRVYWQGRAILVCVDELVAIGCWWVLWQPWVARFVTVLWVVGEGSCAVAMLRRRHGGGHLPTRWTCHAGHRHARTNTALDACHEAWRHRTHDDDCEHGPTRRWAGAGARLRSWTKVAIRPGFAATRDAGGYGVTDGVTPSVTA